MKSKYIIHKLENKQVNNLLLKIYETVIERVQHSNLLRVTFLYGPCPYKNISIKCSKLIGILNKLKRFLPRDIKVTLYNSLMLPYINYDLMVWLFSCNRIIKLQKKAIRIICLTKYNAHTEPLFKKLIFLMLQMC